MKIIFFVLLANLLSFARADDQPPFIVKDNLFDRSQSITLGLSKPKGIKASVVFKAIKGKAQYNHGAVLFPFKGKLFIQWQSSMQDEDAEDTQILFSLSENGKKWNKATTLVPARHNAVVTNGGWWSDGKTLIAYINVWPQDLQPKGGYVEYISSEDGIHWSTPKRLLNTEGNPIEGVIEQDLKQLPSGRILTTIHQQPGLIAKPYFTDHPLAISGWTQGELQNLPHDVGISRELEPSWFLNKSNHIVMVFRDQASSFKVLAAISKDQGETWSLPALTNMPDSRAKQSAGNLPNGSAFLINNPSGSKQRSPLTLTISSNGYLFDKAYLLKAEAELPEMKFPGKYKRVGFSYPKSILWKNYLWASYAVNKEDIEVVSIPLDKIEN